MFKRILVAVDGSPTANQGLRTAVALAAGEGATLYVLHVIDRAAVTAGAGAMEFVPGDYIEGVWQALRKTGQKVLQRAQALALKHNLSIMPLLVDATGAGVAQTVLAQAKKLHADLIVLGTHGRRGLRRFVMGSDAEGVLREANVPVLLVRAGARIGARQATGKPRQTAAGRSRAEAAVH